MSADADISMIELGSLALVFTRLTSSPSASESYLSTTTDEQYTRE